MKMILVRAVGDARLPVLGSSAPRYVGRDRSGDIIPEGVKVPDDSYHRRAILRGDIEAL